jgi:Cu2+-exporting ATPase
VPVADDVEELPGHGLRCGELRLGNRSWCGIDAPGEVAGPELWLARPDQAPVRFTFSDPLRADSATVIGRLRAEGYALELLSGDRPPAVATVAGELGVERWQAACTPAAKSAHLERLAHEGRMVLMVGDGLNDAPALAAAHVSLSPSSAVDISQNAADAVFQGELLAPVAETLGVARRARRLIRQNLALALAYNLIAVPLAMLGLATPLIAAICMSGSSLLVVGNALRLGRGR